MAVIGEEESLGVFFNSDFSVLPLRGGIYDWLRYPRRCHWAGMMDALSGRLRGDGWLKIIIRDIPLAPVYKFPPFRLFSVGL